VHQSRLNEEIVDGLANARQRYGQKLMTLDQAAV